MSYTTVARMRRRLGDLNSAAVSDTIITECIEAAASLVDAFLSSRYQTPISSPPNMIVRITEDITCYHVFNDHIPAGSAVEKDSVIYHRYSEAMKLLRQIQENKLPVPNANELASSSRSIWNSTKGTRPVFDLDHETKWGADSDRLDSVEDERDQAKSTLPGDH